MSLSKCRRRTEDLPLVLEDVLNSSFRILGSETLLDSYLSMPKLFKEFIFTYLGSDAFCEDPERTVYKRSSLFNI